MKIDIENNRVEFDNLISAKGGDEGKDVVLVVTDDVNISQIEKIHRNAVNSAKNLVCTLG